MKKCLCILDAVGLACDGSDSDPSAYEGTTAQPGSPIASAEAVVTQGTIRYAQYQAMNTVMPDKSYVVALSVPR